MAGILAAKWLLMKGVPVILVLVVVSNFFNSCVAIETASQAAADTPYREA
jgi:hypothetical protein